MESRIEKSADYIQGHGFGEVFRYYLDGFQSKSYVSESAAKASLTRHIKRGGVSEEWKKRNAK